METHHAASIHPWPHFSNRASLALPTYFSLSPSHLDIKSEEEMEKKVELLASVATALARKDFPVPGGPKRRIPRQGVRLPGQGEEKRGDGLIHPKTSQRTLRGTLWSHQ